MTAPYKPLRQLLREALPAMEALGLQDLAAEIREALAGEEHEPADPWDRLYYWECKLREATGPAAVAFAEEARRGARSGVLCLALQREAERDSHGDAETRREAGRDGDQELLDPPTQTWPFWGVGRHRPLGRPDGGT